MRHASRPRSRAAGPQGQQGLGREPPRSSVAKRGPRREENDDTGFRIFPCSGSGNGSERVHQCARRCGGRRAKRPEQRVGRRVPDGLGPAQVRRRDSVCGRVGEQHPSGGDRVSGHLAFGRCRARPGGLSRPFDAVRSRRWGAWVLPAAGGGHGVAVQMPDARRQAMSAWRRGCSGLASALRGRRGQGAWAGPRLPHDSLASRASVQRLRSFESEFFLSSPARLGRGIRT